MMRDIREKISAETQNMTFEELKAYIKKKLAENNSIPVGQVTDSRPDSYSKMRQI